jgi:hypothetical protein
VGGELEIRGPVPTLDFGAEMEKGKFEEVVMVCSTRVSTDVPKMHECFTKILYDQ